MFHSFAAWPMYWQLLLTGSGNVHLACTADVHCMIRMYNSRQCKGRQMHWLWYLVVAAQGQTFTRHVCCTAAYLLIQEPWFWCCIPAQICNTLSEQTYRS